MRRRRQAVRLGDGVSDARHDVPSLDRCSGVAGDEQAKQRCAANYPGAAARGIRGARSANTRSIETRGWHWQSKAFVT
jgi:hypothetical protein